MRQPVNLAAIDIGSNGARLLVKRFDEGARREADRIRKLLFARIPLRLGQDVFTLGKVSKEREKMMVHMMKGFKHLMKVYGVETFRACATSAMRDAENGHKVMRKIEREAGIHLEIIKGEEEAGLLFNNLLEKTGSNAGNFAYIDVGGGSTEVSLIHDGVLAESHSFNIGTLRLLSGKVTADTEADFRYSLTDYAAKYGDIRVIGSGGNINKLFRLTRRGKDSLVMDVGDLRRIRDSLAAMSVEERKDCYGLKDDRADVIVPAAETFLKACGYLRCDTIIVPNISLADSIVDGLARGLK